MILAALVFVTALLYCYMATRHSLIVDEAIHGRGGLAILGGDWHLGHDKAMKPFMVYYAMALFRGLGGGLDVAGRIGSILLTCSGILFLFGICRKWMGDRIALFACAIYPFGPLVIKQLHQAKADPLLVFFLLGAAWFATSRRPAWTGFFFALAFCSRQLAAMSFPLVMTLLYLSMYLHDDSGKAPVKWHEPLLRFSFGAFFPLAVLFVWSLFTQQPFAWLVNETTQSKYAASAAYSAGDKFVHWIYVSGKLLASPVLKAVALAGVPACLALVLAGRAGGRYTFRERKDLAALALFSGFVPVYMLFHCIPKMTMYTRFMVPMAPWLSIVVAFCLVFGFRWIVGRMKIPQVAVRPLAFLLVAGLVVSMAYDLVDLVRKYSKPIYRDAVPGAADYLKEKAGDDALVVVWGTGPEFSYYLFDSPVSHKSMERDVLRLKKVIHQNPGRELYAFLPAGFAKDRFEQVQKVLEPLHWLEPVWEEQDNLAFLYRVRINERIGVNAGRVTFAEGDRLTECELSCDLVESFLRRGFSKWRKKHDPAPVVRLTKCTLPVDSGDVFPELTVAMRNVRIGGIAVQEASFAFTEAHVNWAPLLLRGVLQVDSARQSSGSAEISTKALVEHVRRVNENISSLELTANGEELHFEGTADAMVREVDFQMDGGIRLPGDGSVHLTMERATACGMNAPGWLLRYAEGLINPALEADLPSLGLFAQTAGWNVDRSALVVKFGPAPVVVK